ncbi:MAG: Ig-like domain-containing protein [Litorimonas sp.]
MIRQVSLVALGAVLLGSCGGSVRTSAPPVAPAPSNAAPVVDVTASSTSIVEGNAVTLDASGSSDPEGSSLTFTWTQTAGPDVPFEVDGARVEFTPEVGEDTTLTFNVSVSDGARSSSQSVDVAVQNILTTPRLESAEQLELVSEAKDFLVLSALNTTPFGSNAPDAFVGAVRTANGVEVTGLDQSTEFLSNNQPVAVYSRRDGDSLPVVFAEDAEVRLSFVDDLDSSDVSDQFLIISVIEASEDRVREFIRVAEGDYQQVATYDVPGLDAAILLTGFLTNVDRSANFDPAYIYVGIANGRLVSFGARDIALPDYATADDLQNWTLNIDSREPWPRADFPFEPTLDVVRDDGRVLDVLGFPYDLTADEFDRTRLEVVDSFPVDLPDGRPYVFVDFQDGIVFHTDGDGDTASNVATLMNTGHGFDRISTRQQTWTGPAFRKLFTTRAPGTIDGIIVGYLLESGPEAFGSVLGSTDGILPDISISQTGGFFEIGFGVEDAARGVLWDPEGGEVRRLRIVDP